MRPAVAYVSIPNGLGVGNRDQICHEREGFEKHTYHANRDVSL
jgi:hypothetical protein